MMNDSELSDEAALAMWEGELGSLRRTADCMRLDTDIKQWPLFERHEVLPHGIEFPHQEMDAVIGHWADGLKEDVWPYEVVAWWRTPEVETHLAEIREGYFPYPPSGPDLYQRDHVTGGATETCKRLWDARQDWPRAMAIWMHAWCREALNSSQQPCYKADREGRDHVRLLSRITWVALGRSRPDWHWKHGRVCGDELESFDPVTDEDRVLKDEYTVQRAFLNDILRVQTSWGRLTHLVADPTFDPDEFLRRKAEKAAVFQAKQEAEAAARREEQRRRQAEREKKQRAILAEKERVAQVWREERARREENRRLYKGNGAGVKKEAMALGVSTGCLQNWRRKGLSQAQVQWLAARPQGTHRGKSIDEQLQGAGLIEGS